MTITKVLQVISKKLMKLAKQTEKLAIALEKTEKPQAKSVKTKSKVKAVAKKAPPIAGKKTDTDKILEIINRSKKGIDTATLMKKAGFVGQITKWLRFHRQAGSLKLIGDEVHGAVGARRSHPARAEFTNFFNDRQDVGTGQCRHDISSI